MSYIIDFTEIAEQHIAKLKRSEPKLYKKLVDLLQELQVHPTSGTGHPKPLGGNRSGEWSRKLSQKHRLVYKVDEEIVVVIVISAYGHYDDK